MELECHLYNNLLIRIIDQFNKELIKYETPKPVPDAEHWPQALRDHHGIWHLVGI